MRGRTVLRQRRRRGPRADAAFLHHQRVRQSGGVHVRQREIEGGRDLRVLAREPGPADADQIQQRRRDSPHQRVLRLVGRAVRIAAERHDQQQRHAQRVAQRRERIHGVAEPRVLHHHDRPDPAEPGPRADRHRVAFVGGRQVPNRGIGDHAVDERREVRTRHAGPQSEARGAAAVEKRPRRQHQKLPATTRSARLSMSSQLPVP